MIAGVVASQITAPAGVPTWVYIGTSSGSYNGTYSYEVRRESLCPTSSAALNTVNNNYPPSGYSAGYIMVVSAYFPDPIFGTGYCTQHFFRMEVI